MLSNGTCKGNVFITQVMDYIAERRLGQENGSVSV